MPLGYSEVTTTEGEDGSDTVSTPVSIFVANAHMVQKFLMEATENARLASSNSATTPGNDRAQPPPSTTNHEQAATASAPSTAAFDLTIPQDSHAADVPNAIVPSVPGQSLVSSLNQQPSSKSQFVELVVVSPRATDM